MLRNKCLILAVEKVNVDSWEAARCVDKFIHELVVHHCRDVCDAYNISMDGVSVGFRLIEGLATDAWEHSGALVYINIETFSTTLKRFIEEGLLTARLGHVDDTASVHINYNVCFISAGSIIITQEVFPT